MAGKPVSATVKTSSRARLAVGFALVCAACTSSTTGDSGFSFTYSPPPPCTSGSNFWIFTGFDFSDLVDQKVSITAGTSRVISIQPSDCPELVTAVRWSSSRPEVAGGFLPGGTKLDSWLVAAQPGETTITAELSFTDGKTAFAPLKVGASVATLRVVPASTPAGRRVLLTGSVDLAADSRGADPAGRAYLGFEVPAAGTLDIVVDWSSYSNRVIPHVCRQPPPAFPLGCSPIIDGTRFKDRKPVIASVRTTAGTHTLWISNDGPAVEKIRYEVGFVPE